MNGESEKQRLPKDYVKRAGEKQQSWFNRLSLIGGSIIVAIIVYYFQKMDVKFDEIDATISKADINTKAIEKTSRVTHNRISKNHEKLEIVSELSVRADVRSRINERRIDIMEIKRR